MTMSNVSGKLKMLLVFGALLVTLAVGVTAVPFLSEAEPAPAVPVEMDQRHEEGRREASERFERTMREAEERHEARMRKSREEFREAAAKAKATPRPPKPVRRIRRYAWESPAETRARLWNVPVEETEHAVITALVRMCTSEQAGSEPDCIGIWQVLRNVRNRSCDRERIPRITECDDRGETMLSVMRRINRYALGLVPAKTARQRWISELEVDCEMPPSFPRGRQTWERFHVKACQDTVRLASQLVQGKRRQWLTPAHIIAWGGRCEDAGGACDDPIACARGLARVPGLGTANGFWCRPNSPGCADDIDPVCIEMGYRSFRTPESLEKTAVVSADSENTKHDS